MPEPIFADVQQEGATLDIDKSLDRLSEKRDKADETASASHTEKKVVEDKKSDDVIEKKDDKKSDDTTTDDDKLPFHKHPRWIKMQQDLKEAREKGEKVTALETRIAEFEASNKGEKPVELPKWWVEAYGDDDKSKTAYKNYQSATQAERERMTADITKSVTESLTKEQREAQEGEKFVETQLTEMEDEGLKFDRNVLLKFMVDFQKEYGAGSLLDAAGNYDFRKSLKLMDKIQPPEADKTGDVRKKIAGDTMRTKGKAPGESKVPVVSSRSLRRGNWRDADQK